MTWMEANEDNLVMFYPYVPEDAAVEVGKVLSSRWIGQGPKTREFEVEFEKCFGLENAIALNSGTAALHLAYILAGIGPGDEVLCPVFTCTATNIPLLYQGATPVFVDVNPQTMNVDVSKMRKLISTRTKAIVTVDFGGLPCDYDEILELAREFNVPVIQDAAHSLGGSYKNQSVGRIADFTVFSFQAIKHLTTGDGGMLVVKDPEIAEKARRLRWFGIDRQKKSAGVWENDILETGYKYHMNDISAAIGLAGLREIKGVSSHRDQLNKAYYQLLSQNPRVISAGWTQLDSRHHAAWMHTIIVERREQLKGKLLENNIESSPVHYRNDKYSIFAKYSDGNYPNMDSVEDKYLCLPIHTKMNKDDVVRVCNIINDDW